MNYLELKEAIKRKFIQAHMIERFSHMEEVVNMALYLNERFNLRIDEEKIKIAGLVHDYTKPLSMEVSRMVLTRYLTEAEVNDIMLAPTVVHSYTAYYLIKEELGVFDEEIRNAVKYHTTGHPNMTKLEELIFVSDAVEWTRKYPGVDILRKKVMEDFYSGMLLIMETTLKHLQEKGYYINPLTIETYNYYRRVYENK